MYFLYLLSVAIIWNGIVISLVRIGVQSISNSKRCRAYRALYEWIVEQGHEIASDPREIYYTDPDEVPDPTEYVTGIIWPIR